MEDEQKKEPSFSYPYTAHDRFFEIPVSLKSRLWFQQSQGKTERAAKKSETFMDSLAFFPIFAMIIRRMSGKKRYYHTMFSLSQRFFIILFEITLT